MGLYDTMNQPTTPQGGMANGTSAQKSPAMQNQQNSWQQKQQMRANPMMKGRPAMGQPNNQMQGVGQSVGNVMSAWRQGQRPNPTAGLQPGMQGGSRDMMQQKMQAAKNAQTGAIGGSLGQLANKFPQLNDYRNTGQAAGQDMSWMDKPGALTIPANYGQSAGGAQSGLANLQTPYDQQQSNARQQAEEQMRGYEGPDLGSQDPRELARMQNQNQLSGSVGQPMLQNAPYGGEQPGSNSFQSLMENTNMQRPDVVRGLGPSMQMDENGLEARRGPR